MYSATFLIAVHPSSVTSSISHRSNVTSTWREVRTRASRRPSSSSVNRPQATTYGRDSGLPMQPVADQLLVRTGEMARRQAGGPNPLGVPRAGSDGHLKLIGAVARYLPALSGMRLL